MKVLLLISCSKSKLTTPAPARYFYTGRQFQSLVKLARQNSFECQILSGKYGLLELNDFIAPYDQKIKTEQDIKRIRDLSLSKLKKIIPNYDIILVFMGMTYRKVIEPLFDSKFLVIHHPKGLFGYSKILSKCLKLPTRKIINLLKTFNINKQFSSIYLSKTKWYNETGLPKSVYTYKLGDDTNT